MQSLLKLALAATALAAAGTAFGQAAPNVPPVPKHGPIRISGAVEAGMLVSKVQPKYPPEALARHIGGTVVIHALVSKEGLVELAEAITGPDPLRTSAVDAVKQWRYRPYLLNGEPVPVDTTVVVNFNMDAPPPASPPAAVVVPPGSNNTEEKTRTGAVASTPDSIPREKPHAVLISSGVMQGLLVKRVEPASVNADVSGGVVMRVTISEDGHVLLVEPMNGPEMLRANAMAAVKQWQYKPYLLNGKPIEVTTTVVISFKWGQPIH